MRNKNTVNRALVAKNFTKLFTLLIMAAMSMGVMADNVSIPQDLGNYIVVGSSTGAGGFASYITKTNCQVDTRLGDTGNNKYYTIGSTRSDTKVDFHVTASAAGNYVFGFKSGAGNGNSSVITVKMTKDGSDTPMFTSGDVAIIEDGEWNPNIAHNFYIEGVEAADYTLSIEVKNLTGSGSYAGNWGNFYFHSMSQLAWPTSAGYMELSDGTFHNARDNSDNVINYISRAGGYIDDLLIYNSEASYHMFHFNIDAFKQTSKVTITVSDFATCRQEAQETVVVEGNANYAKNLSAVISAGLKKVRFDFADNDDVNDNSYLYNFRQVYFSTIPQLPVGTDYLDLSAGTFGRTASAKYNHNPQYESANQNIGYNGDGGFAEYYVGNTNPTGYCEFHISTRRYQESSFTLTITDVASETVEVNQDFVVDNNSGYADQTCALTNKLTPGLKKLRIETHSESDSYAFNYNHVSFTILNFVREHPHMNLNTLCFPYAISSYEGATFYDILKTEVEAGELTALTLVEHVGALTAGQPYFYNPSGTELVCYYSGDAVVAGTAADDAFVGFYDDDHAVPSGSYVTVNNELYKCGEGITMGEFRAYVRPVAYDGGTPAPGRRILRIGGNKVPTEVDKVQSGNVQSTKVLRDGQLLIIRDGKTYNAQGQLVK